MGAVVVQVHAEDRDAAGTVAYSLYAAPNGSSVAEEVLAVNDRTGEVFTRQSLAGYENEVRPVTRKL